MQEINSETPILVVIDSLALVDGQAPVQPRPGRSPVRVSIKKRQSAERLRASSPLALLFGNKLPAKEPTLQDICNRRPPARFHRALAGE